MAAQKTPALTPEQQREARAAAEKNRREKMKVIDAAMEKAERPERYKDLDKDQRERAAVAAKQKAGLRGKALATWILEGKNGSAQVQEAHAQQEAAARQERTRQNVTRSADPEAAQLAVEAKGLAPDVKSAFLPKDAREFIDIFEVELTSPQAVLIRRKDDPEREPVTLAVRALEKFAKDGEKDADVRKALTAVGKGSRLWGRKLGLMALAMRLRVKGANKD